MNECLSLDILNFVPIENYSFYIKWENVGVPNLSHLIDHQRKDFDTFEQIRQKVKTKNFMQYYSLLTNIPKHIKKQIRENLTDCFNTFNPEDIIMI
jgi:actin-related protein